MNRDSRNVAMSKGDLAREKRERERERESERVSLGREQRRI